MKPIGCSIRTAVLLLVAAYASVHAQSADTFYVDTTGVDAAGRGTAAFPARTIRYTVDNLIDDSLVNPCVIRIRPGSYLETPPFLIDSIITDSVNTLTLEAFNPADPPEIRTDDTTQVQMIRINVSHTAMDHIRFAVTNYIDGGGYRGGMAIYRPHVTIRNCAFYKNPAFGNRESFRRGISFGQNHVKIHNNLFYGSWNQAIVLELSGTYEGIEITNNTFIERPAYRPSGTWNGAMVGVAFWSGAAGSRLRNSKVWNNIFYGLPAGVFDWVAGTNLDVEDDLVWNNMFWGNSLVVDNGTGQDIVVDTVSYNFKANPMLVDTCTEGAGDDGTIAFINAYLYRNSPAIDRGNPRLRDPDGSRADIGAYGGSYADTLAPPQLDTLTVLGNTVSNLDTLLWQYGTVPGDFDMYAVYRDVSGPGFVPSAANIIDSIPSSATTQVIYDNGGTEYFYKVNVWDTDSLGGGYKMFDTIPPYIGADSAIFLSNGTVTPADDTMIVLLSEPVIDPFEFGVPADSFFSFIGLGDLAGCSLSTGTFPNDDTVLIYGFDAGVNIPCNGRSWLAFTNPSVWMDYALNEGTQAGSVNVVTYNVGVKSNGGQFRTIGNALTTATPSDSVFVIDAGFYGEMLTLSIDSLYLCGYGYPNGGGWITRDSMPVIMNPATDDSILYITDDAFISGFKFVCNPATAGIELVKKEDAGVHSYRRCVFDGNNTADSIWGTPNTVGEFTVDSCDISRFNDRIIYSRIRDYTQIISNNRIHDCRAVSSGLLLFYPAGMHTVNQYIRNNIFYNIARDDAVMFRQCRYFRVTGNLFFQCYGGIGWTYDVNENQRNLIAFNTVVQCTTTGIAVNTEAGVEDTVIGNICWSNGGNDFTCRRADSMAYADYNWFTGGNNGAQWTCGANSDSGYPLFVDTAALDFRLQPASECLNFTDFTTLADVAAGFDTLDLDGVRRADPAASYWDAGAYEGGGGPPRIDSVIYWSCGTDSVGDDSLVVHFRRIHNENATIPTGAGAADSVFELVGSGSFANAVVVVPGGGDTNLVVIRMSNADTVLSHNRIQLQLVEGLIRSALDSTPCMADTDDVETRNVYNMRTGTAYPVIDSALVHCVDDDTIMIFDAGYYTDTLNFSVRNVSPYVRGASSYPFIRFNGIGIGGTQRMLITGNRSVRFSAIRFSGITLDGADTCSGSFAEMNGGTVDNCSLYFATFKFDDGALSYMRNCDIFGTRLEWWTEDGGELTGCAIHGVTGNGNALYLYGAENSLIENNRIYDNTVTAVYRRRARSNIIRNNIVYNNAWFGMYGANTPVSRHNRYIGNVFANNGAGLQLDSMSVVRNNIFYNNGQYNVSLRPGCRMPKDSITYNFFDTTDAGMGDSLTGEGNVISTAAPLFADIAGGDFHLRVHSPAIDRGDTTAAWNDYDGSRCDMGAYGGPYAIDTLNPHRPDTLAAFSAASAGYASDTLWWTAYTLPDFKFYAVHRGPDGDFVPAESNCIDSIYDIGVLGARYANDGGAYVYKLSAVDSTDYGSGYRSATYPRVFTAKSTHQTHTVPGDTLVYAVYYDNDGELPTSDTVTFVDNLPANVTFIDTAGIMPHNGGLVDVDWYTGIWQETEPGDPTTVTAIRWQVPAAIAAHEDGGDATGADAGKNGIDTTGGDDAGKVYFRVLVK